MYEDDTCLNERITALIEVCDFQSDTLTSLHIAWAVLLKVDNKIIGKLMHPSLMALIIVILLHGNNDITDKQCT
jgi:hypothetical protein